MDGFYFSCKNNSKGGKSSCKHFIHTLFNLMWVDFASELNSRDVSTGVTGMTAAAPEFSDTLTLSPPGGQILPTIAEVALRV